MMVILLVEDDTNTLELLASILAKKYPDATLLLAANGRAGLELFTTRLPSIVITDINMPEMGGADMAAKIRAISPAVKIIAMTGYTETIAGAADPGAVFDSTLVKPVLFDLLFAAIEQCRAATGV